MNNKKSVKEREKIRIIVLVALALLFIPSFAFALSGNGTTISTDAEISSISYSANNSNILSYGTGASTFGNYSAANINGYFGLELQTQNDISAPVITIVSPINNSGVSGHDITFSYNISDESNISFCTLYIDNNYAGTDNAPIIGNNGFLITNVNYQTHSYYLNCEDLYGNSANTSLYHFTNFAISHFDGETTDLSTVNIAAVPNFTLAKSGQGKVVFFGITDLSGGLNFDNFITISGHSIVIDSASIPVLNKSATLTLYNLPFNNVVIWKDGSVCQNCKVVSNSAGTFVFNVTGFSNYTITSTSKLETFADADTQLRIINQSVIFFANYTNITSGAPVSATCEISFNTGGWTPFVSMNYNASSLMYEYNRSFDNSTQYAYQVNCTPLVFGFDSILLSNVITISSGTQGFAELNITEVGTSRFNDSRDGGVAQTISGNVSRMDFNLAQTTNAWQGYYGSISAKIKLGDSTGNSLYDWGNISVSGEILAARSINIDWNTIDCANAANINSENTFLGKSASADDSVTNTFTLTTHPGFVIASNMISNCYSTKLNGPTGVKDENFWNVILGDNNGGGNIVYANILKNDVIGFTNETVDFELLVAAKNYQLTGYYFYLQLE